MIFPYYLTPEAKQILDLIAKAHFNIRENVSWCYSANYAGGVIKENKTFFICTKTILNNSNPKFDINEAVYHESVHVAQACRGMKPLGIPLKNMRLSSEKMHMINKSIALTKNEYTRRLEHEAYWLEDKPKETIKHLRKFCF